MEVTMKKAVVLIFSIYFILSGYNMLFAQDDDNDPSLSESDINDDIPFLYEADIVALETVLPEDSSFKYKEDPALSAGVGKAENEMPRLNASQPIYHLLVIDRVKCPNSDISDVGGIKVLYKYKHGRNGYLIALYVSPANGPVFPRLPSKSRIILNLSSARPNTILEYVNSNAFKRFVTRRATIRQLQAELRKK
jgi:hypothetical protein